MILRTREFVVYFFQNKCGDFTNTFQMDKVDKLINLIKCFQEFASTDSWILKKFSMAARIWSNNSNITLTCWSITNFLLIAAILVSVCFCHAFGLAFLLSLNFLFTWGYYISTRVEIFHITAIFFNSVYRVEISTRDENLHIINP